MRQTQWEELLWGRGPKLYLAIAEPLSALYGLATKLRAGLYGKGILPSYHPDAPVVSVGNLTPGGSGKTPLVMALAKAFIKKGLKPWQQDFNIKLTPLQIHLLGMWDLERICRPTNYWLPYKSTHLLGKML